MRTPRRSLQILIAVALPLVVLSIDFSGVAVALPDIGRDLDASSGATGWVLNAFALGAAGPVLVSGRIADAFGRRRLLLIGVGLFSVGTLLCAVSWTFEVLVVARVLQGVATSLFMPASLSVVSTSATPERRAWAIGVWSAIGSTAAAAAPVVGGLVVDGLGWRWFFALNVPLLVVAAVMIVALVPESRGDTGRIDLVGAAMVTGAVTAVVYGLQEAGLRGWTDPVVTAALAFGALLFVAFVVEQRRGSDRLIDAAISRSAAFRPPVTVAFLANWGFGALNILLTFWLQDVRGESAAMTGVIFLAYSVPFAILGAVTGSVARRFGTAAPMAVGMVLVVASFLVLTQLGPTAPLMVVVAAMLLSGVGQGLSYNMSTTAAMAAVPDEDAGVASGVLNALRNVGVAAGVALATLATAGGSSDGAGAGFTEGLQRASWVIVVVSLAGVGVAWFARTVSAPRPGCDAAIR